MKLGVAHILLECTYNIIGFGDTKDSGTVMWVKSFGSKHPDTFVEMARSNEGEV